MSFLGNSKLLIPLSLGIIFWLCRQRQRTSAWLVFIGFYGGTLLNNILKQLFKLPRPPDSPIGGYGFPSGHAMNAAIFYSLLILLFAGKIKDRKSKYGFIAANMLLIVLVGLARIMLGVHYISDVVGGLLIGLVWLAAVVWVMGRISRLSVAQRKN